jgi:hypothetical protein
MTDIPIYNNKGIQINSVFIPEDIEYVNGRVCKGKDFYYKGVGVPYKVHLLPSDLMTDEYELVDVSDIFYLGNIVSKKCYQHKFGIFQERHQNHFTDWIGACGIKELNILENLYDENGFELSAIEVLGYETIDEENQQYYLKVNYPGGRLNYLDNPDPKKLRSLIDYMITNNWNFPWDKNSISDISSDSLVTDVADIFHSKDIQNKIGSVYSVLHSLAKKDFNEYLKFCKVNNLQHLDDTWFVFNTLYLLTFSGENVVHLFDSSPQETYKNIVSNYLVTGKNCGFCGIGSCKGRKDANQTYGEEIRDTYIELTEKQFSVS